MPCPCRRMKALEKACRICENCIHYPMLGVIYETKSICDICLAVGAIGGIFRTRWEFNEKKFTEEVEG